MSWISQVGWYKFQVDQVVEKKDIAGVGQVNGETIPVPWGEEEGGGEGYCMAFYSAPPMLIRINPALTPSGYSDGDWAAIRTQNANFYPGWPEEAYEPGTQNEYHYAGCTPPVNNEGMLTCPPDP
jgi:hypothetical protein